MHTFLLTKARQLSTHFKLKDSLISYVLPTSKSIISLGGQVVNPAPPRELITITQASFMQVQFHAIDEIQVLVLQTHYLVSRMPFLSFI